jgi:hypothetical protein
MDNQFRNDDEHDGIGNEFGGDHQSAPGNLDSLAQRVVDAFITLVRRGTALAGGTLVVVTLVCLGGFLLGIAALSDGIRTVWIVFGGAAAIVGIGAVVLAIVRLLAIRASVAALVREVRALISGDPKSERVVIDTLESSDGVQDRSAVVMSQQFFSMKNNLGGRAVQFAALSAALRAVTTFPLLMFLATAVTVGFAFLSLFFLLALAL